MVKVAAERITFFIAPEVADRLRDAVFYTPGEMLSSFVEHAITETIGGLERKRGEPFPKRERPLRAGRPPRMPR